MANRFEVPKGIDAGDITRITGKPASVSNGVLLNATDFTLEELEAISNASHVDVVRPKVDTPKEAFAKLSNSIEKIDFLARQLGLMD